MYEIGPRQEIYDAITETCKEIYRQGERMTIDQVMMRLMDLPGVPMHFPYHHYIMPAALLTLAAMADGSDEGQLAAWLETAQKRGKMIPGGFCGNCGSCGAGVGAGIFFSVYTHAAPQKRDNWNLCNEITGRCLMKIAEYPGPRCCKRTLFLAAQACSDFSAEKMEMRLDVSPNIRCHYHEKNRECLKNECPFYPGNGHEAEQKKN